MSILSGICETSKIPRLSSNAFVGIPGDVVDLFRDWFDPAVILINFLLYTSAHLGSAASCLCRGRPLSANLFVAGFGRGDLFPLALWQTWAEGLDRPVRVVRNTSNAQHLVFAFRDRIIRPEKVFTKPNESPCYIPTEVDPGVPDKRLLLVHNGLLDLAARTSVGAQTLNSRLKQAFLGEPLEVWVDAKSGVLRCEKPHLAVATTLPSEINARCTDLLNRFILFHGGHVQDFFGELEVDGGRLVDLWATYSRCGREPKCLGLTSAALRVFESVTADIGSQYPHAFEQLLKLAMIYAVLAHADSIDGTAAEPAAAIVRWSAALLSLAQPEADPVQAKIAAALKNSADGLTKTDLHELFHRKVPKRKIDAALDSLGKNVTRDRSCTGGRPKTRYRCTRPVEGER